MTVMQFWQEIGVSAAASARAEEVLREKKALLSGLPLERWRTAPYEEGLSALKKALGEDEDGMKLFAAQSMEALLALREYEKRGIGREIFLATMAFMARFSGETFVRRGRAEWTRGWWFPRQLALQEFRLGALEYEMTEGAAFGGGVGAETRGASFCTSLRMPISRTARWTPRSLRQGRSFPNTSPLLRMRNMCASRGCSPPRSLRSCPRRAACGAFRSGFPSRFGRRTAPPFAIGSSPPRSRRPRRSCPRRPLCSGRSSAICLRAAK